MTNDVTYQEFKGHRGNFNLKAAGVDIEWTPHLVEEYIKCSKDPIYFCKTYMRIISKDEGLVPFDLYGYQEQMIRSMHENRYSIFATARQAGKSTVVCGFLLWYVIFNEYKTVALLANKGDTAREIMGKVQLAYQHLPKWLQQGVVDWNKGSMALENGSRVIAAATSSDAIRGYAINLLFIDEAAHIDNWDEFFTAVFPTISSGRSTQVVLVSTPYGLNHFYATWQNAINKKNEYHPIKVMWFDVPGRDDKWKQETLAGMNFDMEKFAQEYEVEFLGSSGSLIAGWKLKELVAQNPIREKEGLRQYKKPVPDNRYALIADVSRGKGLDYSAFSVIDITKMPYEQVCVFRNNLILPMDYTDIIHNVAKHYNDALVLIENNDLGGQVADTLYYDFEYINLVQTENNGTLGKKISLGFSGKHTERGIRTTKTVKNTGCSLLKILVEQNQLIINDFHTIEELARFVRKNTSYEAEPGSHDDLTMGLVLFSWMTDQTFFKDYSNINTLTTLRDKSDEEIMNDLTPFGIIDDGRGEEVFDPDHTLNVLIG
jgi:Terminase large subunit, T4likevirus-type, N-terminal/Terminase RNaseH-like domain